jgi:hypothetical protein
MRKPAQIALEPNGHGEFPLLTLTHQNIPVPTEMWSKEGIIKEGKNGWCPLLWLVFHETLSILPDGILDEEIVNLPLQGGNTALQWAAKWGKPVAAEHLIRHGANPLMPNTEGKTAMDLAEQKGTLLTKLLRKACVTEKKRRLGRELETPSRQSI